MTKPTKQSKPQKPTRQQYSPDFRTEALALADRVGVPEAARQLGLEPPAGPGAWPGSPVCPHRP